MQITQFHTPHSIMSYRQIINIIETIELNRSKHYLLSAMGQIHPHVQFSVTLVNKFNLNPNFTSNYAMWQILHIERILCIISKTK